MVRFFQEKGTAMQQRLFLGGVVLAALALSVGVAGQPLKSGVPVGDSCTPFDPLHLTGEGKDTKRCLV